MGKVWVLDTETKGTGAEMVPLEKLLERRRSAPSERIKVIRRKPDRGAGERAVAADADAGAATEPHRFKVVDAVTGQVLAEDAAAREAVAALAGLRSVVDARIDMWDPATAEWRPLSLGEKKVLWGFRSRSADG
jgi:hypothetical protein